MKNNKLQNHWNRIYQIIALIALLIPFSIIFSFLYNFGYFYEFNIPLSKIPITWNDLILTSFRWIPVVIVGLLIYFIPKTFYMRMQQYNLNKSEIKDLTTMDFLINEKYLILIIIIILFLSDTLYFGSSFRYLFLAPFLLISCLYINWLIYSPNFEINANPFLILFIFLLTTISSLFFFLGKDDARHDYKTSSESIILFQKDNKLNLIRTFERFNLVKNKNEEIEMISNYEHIIPYAKYKPYVPLIKKLLRK